MIICIICGRILIILRLKGVAVLWLACLLPSKLPTTCRARYTWHVVAKLVHTRRTNSATCGPIAQSSEAEPTARWCLNWGSCDVWSPAACGRNTTWFETKMLGSAHTRTYVRSYSGSSSDIKPELTKLLGPNNSLSFQDSPEADRPILGKN